MKKENSSYLSKSDLRNINNAYKDFNRQDSKKNISTLSKSQKSVYYLFKNPENNMQGLHYNNIKGKLTLNFKAKIRQNLKNLAKSPETKRNYGRNLKFFFNNKKWQSIETRKNNSHCIINFINDYENDFFSETAYLNLRYNENEIFKGKSAYDKLVKEAIKNLKKNRNYQKDFKYEKNIKYGKYQKEIHLTFDSLQISFRALNSEDKQDKIINFPFSLLPIFYYKGIEPFIKFLSTVIKIENNFENIIFDEDKVNDALNNLKDYNKENGGDIEDSDEENNDQNYLRHSTKDLNIDKKKIKHLKPVVLMKNNYFLKFNNFIFFWTSNTKTFVVTIILPYIHLNILENKIVIKHFIDFELLFFLYERNFFNWEYYIIKYFSSYSKFRNIFQQIGDLSKIYNKNISLKEPKIKINSFSDEHLMNIYTDQFNNNQIMIFKSFYVNVDFMDLNYLQEKIYHIHFNFYHYLKLYQISEYSNKIYFLIKFLEINKEYNTLNFNYEEFDKFNINLWMSNIKKFSNKSLINNINNGDEELFYVFDILPKKIKVELKRPRWTLIKIEDKEEIQKTCEIENELEKDLIDSMNDSSSESWTKLLNECLKKLNEPIPVIPIIHKKKTKIKISRKNMLSPLEIDKGYKRNISKVFLK